MQLTVWVSGPFFLVDEAQLTERSDNVECLCSLPLTGFAQSTHGELTDTQDSLEDCSGSAKGNTVARLPLTHHDVRSPVPVVGVRAETEEDDELSGEKNTGDVKEHRVYCEASAQERIARL